MLYLVAVVFRLVYVLLFLFDVLSFVFYCWGCLFAVLCLRCVLFSCCLWVLLECVCLVACVVSFLCAAYV